MASVQASEAARIGYRSLQAIHDQTEKLIDECKRVNAIEGRSDDSVKAVKNKITANIVEYKRVKSLQLGVKVYDGIHKEIMQQAEAVVGYHAS